MWRKILFLVFVSMLLVVAVPALLGQQRSGSSASRGGSSSSDRAASAPAPATRSVSSGSYSSSSSSSYDRGYGTSASRVPSIPVQTYSGGSSPIFTSSGWDRCNTFLYYLLHQYPYLPVDSYLWRYAQGDSALTLDSLRLALKPSRSVSGSLVSQSSDLTEVIQAYREGRMSKAEFATYVKLNASEIRNLAKKIRKDRFLDYLDLREENSIPKYETPASTEELLSLSWELQAAALAIQEGIDGFVEEDMSRVVPVTQLQQPSLDSLSKRVDRLAKQIERYTRQL